MTSFPIILSTVTTCLLLSVVFQKGVLPAEAVEYYVTPVYPNPKCPASQPCFVLDQYAVNSTMYFSDRDNVTLHFLDGNHSLTRKLRFTRIEKLLWLGNDSSVHVDIPCRPTIAFTNVSEVVMRKLSIESDSSIDPYCDITFELEVTSIHLEEMLITDTGMNVNSTGGILISNSGFYISWLDFDIIGSNSDHEIMIKNFWLLNSYLDCDTKECYDCQINSTLDNILANHNESLASIDYSDMIHMVLSAAHKVNITNSIFDYSLGRGVTLDVITPQDSEIYIRDTLFSGNRQGGMVVSFVEVQKPGTPLKLTIEDCTFKHNSNNSISGNTASALAVLSDLVPLDIFIIRSSFFSNINTQSIPITVLIASYSVTITNCSFSANIGTALKTYNSHVYMFEEVHFMNNSAYEGGGMVLVNSYLHLSKNTSVIFLNNTAQDVGGGILVKQSSVDEIITYPVCFYQIDNEIDNVVVNMINNTAQHGGDHIYGASLKSQCEVNSSHHTGTGYNVSRTVFHFESSSHLSQVSSDPKRVCQCDQGVPNCTDINKIFDTTQCIPGETFNISAALVGDDFGVTSGTIYTHFASPNPSKFSISDDQISQTVNYSCNEVLFTIYSNKTEGWEELILTPFLNTPPHQHSMREMQDMQNNVDNYMQKGYIPTDLLQTPIYINVSFIPCPHGFEHSNGVCQCDQVLVANNINCTIENHTGYIYRSGSVWINASYDDNHTFNGIIVNSYCPHQYCEEEMLSIELEEPDKQCAFNHAGTLCGSCKQGYSLVLGSQKCLTCTNNRGISLLAFFIVAGFMLVLFVKFFDLTVTYGAINGLIFYANIIWANQSILFPEEQSLSIQMLKVFIAWINLDFGIETCFFIGLDAYWKTWMQFLFPFYIWTIAIVIIILSRHSAVMTRLFGNNSVPVLATLILLSYAKLLRTIINILEVAILDHPGGHQSFVWALDGNVPYIVSKHGPLFCAGIAALLLLWLPYTMALFLVPWLRAISNWKCFRWINKLKPFFDANYGPLKDRHHYWIGLLLLVRGFLFIIMLLSMTSIVKKYANLLTIVVTVLALLGHPEPYKKWYMSLLEKSFLINVIVFCIGVFYVDRVGGSKSAVTITSLGFALAQFVMIFLVHAYAAICRLRMCNKICPHGGNKKCTHIIESPCTPNSTTPRLSLGEDRYNLLRDTMPESDDEAD